MTSKKTSRSDRDPFKEYNSQIPVATPVSFRGLPTQRDEFRKFMDEWSRDQAEANHVETIEEANDFDIGGEEEDDDFFEGITPYEMHEMQIDTEEAADPVDAAMTGSPAENNDSDDRATGTPETSPDPSAPVGKPAGPANAEPTE